MAVLENVSKSSWILDPLRRTGHSQIYGMCWFTYFTLTPQALLRNKGMKSLSCHRSSNNTDIHNRERWFVEGLIDNAQNMLVVASKMGNACSLCHLLLFIISNPWLQTERWERGASKVFFTITVENWFTVSLESDSSDAAWRGTTTATTTTT